MTDQLSTPAPSGAPAETPEPVPASSSRDLVVASVPSGHVYVRHLADPDASHGIIRLPDPTPADAAGAPGAGAPGRWWPPAMLDPRWVERHDFDLMHLHFGFDAWDPARLEDVVDALHGTGRPLVYTVHDLRNPHHTDRALHDAQLDVLVPRADALVTLSSGAAEEVRRRWGRTATVLPHPHVVDLETMGRLQRERRRRERRPGGRQEFRVGLHVKSLRSGTDPMSVLPVLLESVSELPGGVLQVNAHRDVLEPAGARHDARLATWLHSAAARGLLELHVHDYLDDQSLWRYLSSLDVSVLAYRSGTHSGWLEACRDLGTAVIAPTCGYYADQETDGHHGRATDGRAAAEPPRADEDDSETRSVRSYVMDTGTFDPDSLAGAIEAAHRARPAPAATVEGRRAQRTWLAEAHADLYRAVR